MSTTVVHFALLQHVSYFPKDGLRNTYNQGNTGRRKPNGRNHIIIKDPSEAHRIAKHVDQEMKSVYEWSFLPH